MMLDKHATFFKELLTLCKAHHVLLDSCGCCYGTMVEFSQDGMTYSDLKVMPEQLSVFDDKVVDTFEFKGET